MEEGRGILLLGWRATSDSFFLSVLNGIGLFPSFDIIWVYWICPSRSGD